MKKTLGSITLVCSLLTLGGVASAQDAEQKRPGAQGVIIDISNIDLSDDGTTSSIDAAEAEAEIVGAVDADPSAGSEALATIMEFMTPEEPVAALTNDRFSFYLSDEVIFAQLERSADRFGLDNGRMHLGFLFSEERDAVLQGGLAVDAAFTRSFRLSFGTRAYIAILNEENMDALALSLGSEAAYVLPFEALPLEFGASLYYAPDVLTFGAGDRAIDAQVDVAFPFRSQLSVFGGVRFLQIDTRPGDEEIDNRVHLGLRWDFL